VTSPSHSFEVTPFPGGLGARIEGLDARRPLGSVQYFALDRALIAHGVLVLPGQILSVDEHVRFTQSFGTLLKFERSPARRYRVPNPFIDDVSNLNADGNLAPPEADAQKFKAGNQLWHSDLSFRDPPAKASLLLCYEAAPEGGTTEFADMMAACDRLPPATVALLEGKWAEHDILHSRVAAGYDGVTDELRRTFRPSAHPILRPHPDTGRRVLYVGAHAARILGMPDGEAAALLTELLATATRTAPTYSHTWTAGDLVIWDNRRVVHRGRPFGASKHRRVLHRTTTLCDRPSGPPPGFF
jgi:alpha-ketoglutarate-dependent 2,4-dichlorophenoxyacetate dioxygenase